jgi:UDP-N-acetyl-alpha-D-muramoyl-L-alanyl-L-glutamate epimerase
MVRSSRQNVFLQLREQFPFFAFEKQEYSLTALGLEIRYSFNLAGQHLFHPTLFIPRKSCFLADEYLADHLDNIVFNLGMIELISYWKAACPPTLIIRPFALHPEQIAWWKNIYFHGLGEFFYLNSLEVTEDNFMQIEILPLQRNLPEEMHNGASPLHHTRACTNNTLIIPVGGGKDSAVTLELLGTYPGSIPLILNPRGASLETIAAKGFSAEQFIEIHRTIDPELLKMNDEGFLNGHTPFSAMLAFVTVLSAIVTGHRNIALSNESSANEATIEGTDINHQYSKSFQFESDFRAYVKRWICKDINYFSFLRPLNELQIAFLFSKFPRFHPVFKSCNAGSKTNSWCGTCAKCLFTYTILSPFLTEEQLVNIYGKNLFADESLKPLFDQLTGVADEKPFDCVGTIREVNLALCETIRQRDKTVLPYLLEYYKNSQTYLRYNQVDFVTDLLHISDEHHLMPECLEILKNWFSDPFR